MSFALTSRLGCDTTHTLSRPRTRRVRLPRSVWCRRPYSRKWCWQVSCSRNPGAMSLGIRGDSAWHGRTTRETVAMCFGSYKWGLEGRFGRSNAGVVSKWERVEQMTARSEFFDRCVSVTVLSRARKCLFARSLPISKQRIPKFNLANRFLKCIAAEPRRNSFSLRLYNIILTNVQNNRSC